MVNGLKLILKQPPSTNIITSNGNYTIPSSTVTGTGNVNVKTKVTTLVDKEITENGTYNATDDEADGYSQVVVDVTPPSNEFYPTMRTQSLMLQNDIGDTWLPKTWTGLTKFDGSNIWTDGDNIYYSSSTNQYVLDKSTSTWSTKTWNGLTNFGAAGVWTDGDNIYFNSNYVLDKSTSTWSTKTWNGFTSFYGNYVWTDGDNIYYSYGSDSYILDKSTSTWSTKTWAGLSEGIYGDKVWTDGDNIYFNSDFSDPSYYLPITKKSFPRTTIKPEQS